MKEEITKKMLEYLNNTHDFVLDQVPQVIQQALLYEKTSAYISSFFMLFLLILATGVFYYFWKHPFLDEYKNRKISSVMGMYIPGSSSLIFFIILCSSIDTLIKIYIAPKYFLIQLLMSMKK